MSDAVSILLDEHVGRVFERLLDEHGFDVRQAKDLFGEHTVDRELLQWCADRDTLLVSNDAKDFRVLHAAYDHAGVMLFEDPSLPDADPEGVARTVDEVLTQYGADGLRNQVVVLDEWYDWLHG